MARALAAGVAAALEAGDTTTARVALEALRALVDVAVDETTATRAKPPERAPEGTTLVDRPKRGSSP